MPLLSRTANVPPIMQINAIIIITVTASGPQRTSIGAVNHLHTAYPPSSRNLNVPGTITSLPSTIALSNAPLGITYVRIPAPIINNRRIKTEEKKDFLLICNPALLFSTLIHLINFLYSKRQRNYRRHE